MGAAGAGTSAGAGTDIAWAPGQVPGWNPGKWEIESGPAPAKAFFPGTEPPGWNQGGFQLMGCGASTCAAMPPMAGVNMGEQIMPAVYTPPPPGHKAPRLSDMRQASINAGIYFTEHDNGNGTVTVIGPGGIPWGNGGGGVYSNPYTPLMGAIGGPGGGGGGGTGGGGASSYLTGDATHPDTPYYGPPPPPYVHQASLADRYGSSPGGAGMTDPFMAMFLSLTGIGTAIHTAKSVWDFGSKIIGGIRSTVQGWIDTAGGYYFGEDNWQSFKANVKAIYDNPITQLAMLFVPGPEEIVIGKLLAGLVKLGVESKFILAGLPLLSRLQEGVHTVYEIENSLGELIYIGRTMRSVGTRLAEHAREWNGLEKAVGATVRKEWQNLTYAQARILEDYLIRHYGLDNLLNKKYGMRIGVLIYPILSTYFEHRQL